MLTQKSGTFGAVQDDVFVDVTIDTTGNMYLAGHTYSVAYAYGDQDIVVFKMNSDMKHLPPNGWGIVWGGTLVETATGIALDSAEKYVYVSGYSNSVGSLASAKYDMLILKFSVSSGLITWGKRFGSTGIDKANGIAYYADYVYVVGESDSPGWAS